MRTFLEYIQLPAYLYHGTSADILRGETGIINPPSYWGTERVAHYYAEESDNGKVIRVSFSRFNISKFKPDQNSIAEPLTHTLKSTEDALWDKWHQSDGTWQDCLAIFESILYTEPVQINKNDFERGW